MDRRSLSRFVAVASCAFGVAALAVAVAARRRSLAADFEKGGSERHGTAFAGSTACASCHPDHTASWRRTFHRTMTQDVPPVAGGGADLAGDFSGVSYHYAGVRARMSRDSAGRYLMTFSSDGGGGGTMEAVVVRAIGSRRYQQYLADVKGTLWRLPMAYHIEEKRWFPMNGAFLTPDPEPTPVDTAATAATVATAASIPSGGQPPRFGGGDFDRHVTRWNDNCVFCHNVGPNPGRDPVSGRFRTVVAELGIACEACHGPGAEHARVNEDPLRRYALHGADAPDRTIVNPSRLSPSRSADVCGRCHGQRITDDVAPFLERGDPFVPGEDLGLYSSPLWRDTTLAGTAGAFAARFWNDGTPRLTAYEYQGLLQSPCAQRGTLTCTSCHGMHDGDPRGQLRPAAVGDHACTQCHSTYASPAAVAAHTRHDPTGPGARCVACHMPPLVYGVLAIHPSHRIEIPDPARAAAAGRPDACTLCHVEADRAWASQARARLWPTGVPGQRSFAPATPPNRVPPAAPGDEVNGDGSPRDAVFAGDPLARAVAADALGRAPWPVATAARAAAESLRAGTLLEVMAGDKYPAVRHLAARALARILLEGGRHPEMAKTARAFDPTGPRSERDRAIAALRGAGAWPPLDARNQARILGFREEGRRSDIDIGE